MNDYIMLGRFHIEPKSPTSSNPNRELLTSRIYARADESHGTRIQQVHLTLGHFDVVIYAQASSPAAAYDLASEIQEATNLSIESLMVVPADRGNPATPPDPGDPAPVREPRRDAPDAGEHSAYATPDPDRFQTVADALSAPEPATRRAQRRQRGQ